MGKFWNNVSNSKAIFIVSRYKKKKNEIWLKLLGIIISIALKKKMKGAHMRKYQCRIGPHHENEKVVGQNRSWNKLNSPFAS